MKLISNVGTDRVVDHMSSDFGEMDAAVAAISLFALRQLTRTPKALRRVLVAPLPDIAGSADDRRRRNQLVLRGLANQVSKAIADTEFRQPRLPLRQSVLLVGRPTQQAFSGACDLTTDGLGLAPSAASGLVQFMEEASEIAALRAWFETLWRDAILPEVPHPLHEVLISIAANVSPDQIYQRALSSLFADMAVEAQDQLPDSRIGFTDSKVWQMLYRFQDESIYLKFYD